MGSLLVIKIVAYFLGPVLEKVVRTWPNIFCVLSSIDVIPFTSAVITHHLHPIKDTTCTAPQENFSQTGTPSSVLANALISTLSLDASPTSSFAVGSLAKVFPSLLFLKPFGGHIGAGEGITFDFSLATEMVDAVLVTVELATGVSKAKTSVATNADLITVPLKFSNREKYTDD